MKSFIWLALAVIFLILEGTTVRLVSIWFTIGSIAAMIAAGLGSPVWLQIALFLAVSSLCLAALGPLVRKHITPKIVKTNVDSVIGQRGYVKAGISNEKASGCVKLGAMEWTARSTSGQDIPEGALVRVDRVEGVKVFVSPVEESEPVLS